MVERILVRGPNWVGDLVMATASFADLRRSFPGARLEYLIRPSREGILSGASYFDGMLPDPGPSLPRALRLAREVRRRKYDLALIYPNSFWSALPPALAGVPRRVGFAGPLRRFLLTHVLEEQHPAPPRREGRGPRRFPYPMAVRYAELIREAGAQPGDGRPVLVVSAACEERAEERRRKLGIAPGERLIGLNPGASFGSSKVWPLERFARLADLLCERMGRRALIFLGPGEEALARNMAGLMRHPPVTTADLPLDLDLLKPFVRDLTMLVTTDTGVRHYAVAFHVPVVVIMGPTHPGFTAANLEETEVVRKDVPCGPCHLKICPLDHRCMTLIEPEEVLERAEGLLARVGARAQ